MADNRTGFTDDKQSKWSIRRERSGCLREARAGSGLWIGAMVFPELTLDQWKKTLTFSYIFTEFIWP